MRRSSRLVLRHAPLVMLLAPALAHAHYPHDVAHWAAISPDPAHPRWATSLERIDLDLIGRSDDTRQWDARLIQPTSEGTVDTGVFLTADRLVLGSSRSGLLISEDAGDHLAPSPDVTDDAIDRVVASPTVMEDGLAFAAGSGSLWRTVDGGVRWEAVWSSAGKRFTDVDVSPTFDLDQRVCGLQGRYVSCSEDAGDHWVDADAPRDTWRISVGAEGRLWAIVREGGLYRSDDDGQSWTLAGFEGEDVAAIAELSNGLVLVATAHEAEWRSTDGGETWAEVPVMTVTEEQTSDGVNFFDFFEGPDGAVYLSCWYGFARSTDRGRTFRFFTTERVENTHSVTLTEGRHGTTLAWVGTYGSGPVLIDLDGPMSALFPSLERRYTRNTPSSRHWQDDGTALFDEGYTTWLTTDHGVSWTNVNHVGRVDGHTDYENDVKGVALSPDMTEDPFLLLSIGESKMRFDTSTDGGATFVTGTQEPACEQYGLAATIAPDWPTDSRAWASCGGLVYQTVDRGLSWQSLGDTGAFIFDFAVAADGALLVATADGLWRQEGGALRPVAFDGEVVVSVDATADPDAPAAFALVPKLGWMRSEDDGARWDTLDAPTADVPRMVSVSPRYAEDHTVAVAGYGGAWASQDGGETWRSIYATEAYELDHRAWETTGAWEHVLAEDASGGGVERSTMPGSSKAIEFRGVGVVLESPIDAEPGLFLVSLDDGPPEEVTLPSEDGFAWWATDLEDTWHTLRVEAAIGAVTLDDARITRIAADPRATHVPETTALGAEAAGCGCASATAPSPWGWGVMALGLAWRRSQGRRASR